MLSDGCSAGRSSRLAYFERSTSESSTSTRNSVAFGAIVRIQRYHHGKGGTSMRVIFASLLLAVACGSSQEKPASTPLAEPQTESSSAPPAEPQAEPLKSVEIGEPRKDGTCPSTSVLRGGKCVIEGTEIIVLEPVPFEENSSEIGPKAATIIGNVAEILKKHPEFSKLEIAGHARPG